MTRTFFPEHSRLAGVVLATVFTLTGGCDYGIGLRPRGSEKRSWTRQIEKLEVSCEGFTGLEGWESTGMLLTIRNTGSTSILLREALLTAGGKTYQARLNWDPNEPVRVAPGLFENCHVDWDFEKPASRILSDGCVIVFRFQIDGMTRDLRLDFGE